MKGTQVVVALIRLAGLQTIWSAFWNLTYVPEHKVYYLLELQKLPTRAEISLIAIKMIIFRAALSTIFGMTLLIFADPLARLLMKEEKGLATTLDKSGGLAES
jgi:hypothetical protein